MRLVKHYLLDEGGDSPVRFVLVATAVAIIVVRAVEMLGFDVTEMYDTVMAAIQ